MSQDPCSGLLPPRPRFQGSAPRDMEYRCMFRGLVKDLWSGLSAAPKVALACLLQTKVWESILWKISCLLHTPSPNHMPFPRGRLSSLQTQSDHWGGAGRTKDGGQKSPRCPIRWAPGKKELSCGAAIASEGVTLERVSASAGHRSWGPYTSFPLSPSLHSYFGLREKTF